MGRHYLTKLLWNRLKKRINNRVEATLISLRTGEGWQIHNVHCDTGRQSLYVFKRHGSNFLSLATICFYTTQLQTFKANPKVIVSQEEVEFGPYLRMTIMGSPLLFALRHLLSPFFLDTYDGVFFNLFFKKVTLLIFKPIVISSLTSYFILTTLSL